MIGDEKMGWTGVEMDFTGDFEGLLGFEEITDYKIETLKSGNEKSKKKAVNKKKKLKRKESKNKTSEIVEETERNNEIKDNKCIEIDETDYYPWNNIFVPKEVSRALLEEGYKEPTEIQALTIPPAIKGRRDILGAAETGSGKTLAFAIPIIYGILKNMEKGDEANDGRFWSLILTPTRELTIQIKNHISVAIRHTPLKVAVVVGGMSSEKQSRILRKEPHIVVATPGRLWDLISTNDPHLSKIADIRYLVIDETDRMIETNHFPELRSLLEKLNADPVKVKLRQNFVFSATLALVHELPSYVRKRKRGKRGKITLSSEDKMKGFINLVGMTDPKIVDITKKTGTAERLTEAKIASTFDDKDVHLYYILSMFPGRSLIFCNSISCVRRLASLLTALGQRPLPLHANMQQRQRLKNLDKFKQQSTGLLLATDVAARGLDIPSVQNVIHYQVPRTSETYVHRSGRTARAMKEGLTVVLIEPSEASLYNKICTTLKREKDLQDFPVDQNLFKKAKERVRLAREIDRLNLSLKKEKSQIGWIEKAAEEMDILLDEDEKPRRSDDKEIATQKKRMLIAKKQLESLLKTPLSVKKMQLQDVRHSVVKAPKVFKKRKIT